MGSCPDYSHNGNIYTHEGLGEGVPFLTQIHLQHDNEVLRVFNQNNIPFRYTIMIADVEAIDKVFCERFTDGSQQEFLDRCSRSQAASQEYISNLDLPSPIKENMHSSSFFAEFGMERFIHFQEEYQRALTLRSQTDGSFRMRLGNDMAARSEMYQKMYRTILPNLDVVQREEFLTQRTIRTMAQYLTLGKLISESSRYPVIISHPTRNSGMFNDRNKYMLDGEIDGQQHPVPILTMERSVY